jgi:hypothetical protein
MGVRARRAWPFAQDADGTRVEVFDNPEHARLQEFLSKVL